ncbi:cupredoxin domain-containing protein [Pseudoduganella sp. UC29_106]|uniref:cupredoxin domain-containing protein n=1 Tax=Pseudoduganella sp. UC29_106 TaxID=3374553 RepID=UPI0037565A48
MNGIKALTAVLLSGALLAGAGARHRLHEPGDETTIQITAQRFHYSPDEITVKRGTPVVLAITSLDFVHGFKVPELGIRVDLPPGRVTEVRFTPQKTGRFDFLCDNFCGSGHEEMSGRIVVVD